MMDPNEPMLSTRFLGGVKGTSSLMNVSVVIASGGRISQTGILPEKSLDAAVGSNVNTSMRDSSTGVGVLGGLRTVGRIRSFQWIHALHSSQYHYTLTTCTRRSRNVAENPR